MISKLKIALLALTLSITSSHAKATYWGATGHRTVGKIAEKYLTKKAKKAISNLLDGHTLSFYSTFADEIKSDNKYRKYSTWHYVNFKFDEKYNPSTASKKGDLIQGINTCVKILKDPSATKADKAFHLKLLIHFIGDLHQPLHVGHAEDRGGNDIKVKWFNKPSNLHRVWDSEMITSYKMSYTELAKNANKLSKAQVQALQKGSILDWVYDSQALAKKVYASAKNGNKLHYRYSYDYLKTVRLQLQKGGVRLAKVLNDIFG
jgi:nuclease S1